MQIFDNVKKYSKLSWCGLFGFGSESKTNSWFSKLTGNSQMQTNVEGWKPNYDLNKMFDKREAELKEHRMEFYPWKNPKVIDHEWYYPSNGQLNFQAPRSPMAEGIISFHNDLMFFIVGIFIFVITILLTALRLWIKKTKMQKTYAMKHAATLEIIWTIIPALILIVIAIPSFSLLYSLDELVEPSYIFKAIGHQWYWTYEINVGTDTSGVNTLSKYSGELTDQIAIIDSYMVSDEDILETLKKAENPLPARLLAVDHHIVLPILTNVSALVTSADVIHAWAVPSAGVKVDACPGRLNQVSFYLLEEGLYYGQCSELCGVNHAFMPIGVLGVDLVFASHDGFSIDLIMPFVQEYFMEFNLIKNPTNFGKGIYGELLCNNKKYLYAPGLELKEDQFVVTTKKTFVDFIENKWALNANKTV